MEYFYWKVGKILSSALFNRLLVRTFSLSLCWFARKRCMPIHIHTSIIEWKMSGDSTPYRQGFFVIVHHDNAKVKICVSWAWSWDSCATGKERISHLRATRLGRPQVDADIGLGKIDSIHFFWLFWATHSSVISFHVHATDRCTWSTVVNECSMERTTRCDDITPIIIVLK